MYVEFRAAAQEPRRLVQNFLLTFSRAAAALTMLIYTDYGCVSIFACLVGWIRTAKLGMGPASDAKMENVHAVSGRAGPVAIPCSHVIAG